ncbi:hypothetical protein SUGI_0169330 [Cryptomeria japonica]|nr:hypothetical protein SUGI_0169330 [Cryptomeria japonica]
MDPALVAFCDKIAAQGGPTRLSEDSTTNFPSNPVAQPVHITRASECLRNVQPDMNVSQSYEVLKRSKQNSDPDQGKVVAGDSDPFAEDRSQPMEIDTPGQNTLKTKCLHGSVTNEAFKGVQQCEANNQEEIMNQPERKSSSKVPISNHLSELIESIEDNL